MSEAQKTVPFQTETAKLLQMMIHSVYTKKEIFLRELISNASDALDKRFALALSHPDGSFGPLQRERYAIRLSLNKPDRLLTISDNGIGMDEAELRQCLGTIAFSGSERFGAENAEAAQLIGQFGIGFYSLFMAADHVKVISRKAGTARAYSFESDGIDSYVIGSSERSECGTDVILHIREENEDDEADTYNRYLREYTLYQLVKQYSDYVRWPILLYMPIPVPDEHGEPTEKWSWERLNSMTPLWMRKRSDVSEADYEAFWREHVVKPNDLNAENHERLAKPLRSIPLSIEGTVQFRALLYIPPCAWNDWDTEKDSPGLELYSSGVKISEHEKRILPEEYPFLRGAVDCPDLSLNLARDEVRSEKTLRLIREAISKRIRRALIRILAEDRSGYEIFFESFGRSLKLSAMEDPSREELKDLLLFESREGKISLQEYIASLHEGQNGIYYARGKNREEIARLPETERAEKLGVNYLCFTDPVDGLFAQVFNDYQGHPFISLSEGEAEAFLKRSSKTRNDEGLREFILEVLGNEIDDAVLSDRLESHPVMLGSGEGITFEMEREMKRMGSESPVRAKKILEINPDHPAVRALKKTKQNDRKTAEKYVRILYQQARLIAGLEIGDPIGYTDLICSLWYEEEGESV